MRKQKKYISPKITEKKIKVSFFLSNSRFNDSMNMTVGPLLAQASACVCGTCPDGGGVCADGCATGMCT